MSEGSVEQQAGCMFFGLDFILDDGEQSVIELK